MNTIKSIGSALPSLPSFSIGLNTTNFDSAATSAPPLPTSQLNLITTHREALLNFKTTLNHHIKYLGKRKTNPCGLGTKSGAEARRADSSISWIGEEFKDAGERLESEEQDDRESRKFATILSETGATHLSLSKIHEDYLDILTSNTLTPLEYRLDTYKQFFTLHSSAEKSRNALESLVSKQEKNKDNKAAEELELELEEAERAYQDKVDEVTRAAEKLIEGFSEETAWIKSFIDDEIEFYTSSLSTLNSLRSSLDSSSSTPPVTRFSSPLTTAPTLPSRSTSLRPPSTRMSRSKSDVTGSPTFSSPEKDRTSFLRKAIGSRGSAGDLTSSIGGGKDDGEGKRSRSSSVREKEKDEGKRSRSGSLSVREIEDGKRSRSGSGTGMLSRVPGFRKKSHSVGEKEKDGKGKGKDKEDGDNDDETVNTEHEDDNDDEESIHKSGGGFGLSLPSLPTLNSIKKLGGNDTSDYSTLTDDILIPRDPTPATLPPALKRTQTAPPRTPTSTPSTPTKPTTPLNRTYIASWPYPPSSQEQDEEELIFDKNDLIKVSSIVNDEWWVGKIIRGENEGMVGLFPKGFVKEWKEEGGSERKKAPPPPPPGRKRALSPGVGAGGKEVKDEKDPFSDV